MSFEFTLHEPPCDVSFLAVVNGPVLYNADEVANGAVKEATIRQIGWHALQLPPEWFFSDHARELTGRVCATMQCTIQYMAHRQRRLDERLSHAAQKLEALRAERDEAFAELLEVRETAALAKQRCGERAVRPRARAAVSGGGSFVCALCGNAYPSTSSLHSHLRKRHHRAAVPASRPPVDHSHSNRPDGWDGRAPPQAESHSGARDAFSAEIASLRADVLSLRHAVSARAGGEAPSASLLAPVGVVALPSPPYAGASPQQMETLQADLRAARERLARMEEAMQRREAEEERGRREREKEEAVRRAVRRAVGKERTFSPSQLPPQQRNAQQQQPMRAAEGKGQPHEKQEAQPGQAPYPQRYPFQEGSLSHGPVGPTRVDSVALSHPQPTGGPLWNDPDGGSVSNSFSSYPARRVGRLAIEVESLVPQHSESPLHQRERGGSMETAIGPSFTVSGGTQRKPSYVTMVRKLPTPHRTSNDRDSRESFSSTCSDRSSAGSRGSGVDNSRRSNKLRNRLMIVKKSNKSSSGVHGFKTVVEPPTNADASYEGESEGKRDTAASMFQMEDPVLFEWKPVEETHGTQVSSAPPTAKLADSIHSGALRMSGEDASAAQRAASSMVQQSYGSLLHPSFVEDVQRATSPPSQRSNKKADQKDKNQGDRSASSSGSYTSSYSRSFDVDEDSLHHRPAATPAVTTQAQQEVAKGGVASVAFVPKKGNPAKSIPSKPNSTAKESHAKDEKAKKKSFLSKLFKRRNT